jgi:hypothetical protein
MCWERLQPVKRGSVKIYRLTDNVPPIRVPKQGFVITGVRSGLLTNHAVHH